MKPSRVHPRTPRLPVVPRYVAGGELAEISAQVAGLEDRYWTAEFYGNQVDRLLGHIAALEMLAGEHSGSR